MIYGAASGELTPVPPRSLYALRSVTGFSLLALRRGLPEQARRDVADVTEHFRTGRLQATVHTRLPLTDSVAVHEILESRANLGRVLVTP